MKNVGKIIVLSICLLFVCVNFVAAQQPVRERISTPTPTPTETPTPTPVPAESPLPIDDDEVLTVDTELVNVLFTATDSNRRFLLDLKKEDIRVLEDGKQQEIFTFYRQVDLPLSLSILIDVSGSQQRTLPEEKEAAKAFVENVVRPNKDEVSILSFTGETTLEQDLTGNIGRIRRAIDRVVFTPAAGTAGGVGIGTPPLSGGNQRKAGSTAIWDAVWVTSDEILSNAPEKTRRGIILLSDGFNTYGSKKMEDAIRQAIKNEVIIYCVGIGDYYYDGVNEGALRKLAESTGGHAYFPREESQLRRAFDQIQLELRSQFLVAYEPSNPKKDGSYRKIEIQVANPEIAKQKVKLTHREGYFAKTEKKTDVKPK
jgi:Ca-activated chloride channel homolog